METIQLVKKVGSPLKAEINRHAVENWIGNERYDGLRYTNMDGMINSCRYFGEH